MKLMVDGDSGGALRVEPTNKIIREAQAVRSH